LLLHILEQYFTFSQSKDIFGRQLKLLPQVWHHLRASWTLLLLISNQFASLSRMSYETERQAAHGGKTYHQSIAIVASCLSRLVLQV